eukprot:199454-Prymnesium_polylepis.1
MCAAAAAAVAPPARPSSESGGGCSRSRTMLTRSLRACNRVESRRVCSAFSSSACPAHRRHADDGVSAIRPCTARERWRANAGACERVWRRGRGV